MATIKNITNDTRRLFRVDAPPVDPGDEVTVKDENFVGRAWPTSTWDLVEKPKLDGYVDASTDDAHLYLPAADLAEQEGGPDEGPLPELPEGAYAPNAEPLPDDAEEQKS